VFSGNGAMANGTAQFFEYIFTLGYYLDLANRLVERLKRWREKALDEHAWGNDWHSSLTIFLKTIQRQ